jgi:streptogramin lyase
MKRLSLAVPILLASTVLVAGCVGDTDPATDVTSKTARLNAHGHTNNGPATWWWEYSSSKPTLEAGNGVQVCGVGTGPKEPDNRCGPAETPNSNDIPLNVVITGLAPNTTYYFRACGKDQSAQSGSCLTIRSFKTLKEYYVFDRKWGSQGSGDGQFDTPGHIATFRPGGAIVTLLYVADAGNDRIQKFNSLGTFLTKWGSLGSANGRFDGPRGVATDSAGDVYVADTNNNRIQKFSSTGSFITKWGRNGGDGTAGTGNGQFDHPAGVATDSAGNVYVADTDNDRIQKFGSTGAFLTKWGSNGVNDGQFLIPMGVATDSTGNVYVSDTDNDRIQKFSSTGVFLTKWGSVGNPLDGPRGIDVDSAGNVYEADFWNNRIQKFTGNGSLITSWGAFGTGNGQFADPFGVATDTAGSVYVTEYSNNRIQKFQKE